MKSTGYGVTLSRGNADGPPETFTAIAQVTNVTPTKYARDTVDVTDKDSTGGYKEFIGGLKDAGEVSAEVNYDPAVHNTLLDDFDSDTPNNWQVSFPGTPTATTCTFAALLSGFAPAAPMDAKMTATITLKISGKPTWA